MKKSLLLLSLMSVAVAMSACTRHTAVQEQHASNVESPTASSVFASDPPPAAQDVADAQLPTAAGVFASDPPPVQSKNETLAAL